MGEERTREGGGSCTVRVRHCHRLIPHGQSLRADNQSTYLRGDPGMARRSRLPIGPLIAVCLLTLLFCLGVVYVYIGWEPLTEADGLRLTETRYGRLALGPDALIMLGD